MKLKNLKSSVAAILIGAKLLSTPLIVNAAHFYVSQAGSGTTNSMAWLTANWNLINPGDTVHLVGTFTTPLLIGKSGMPGNPFTVYFEPNAKFSAPTWPSGSYILGQTVYSLHDVVIDGGVNGLIEATANGTGLANSNSFSAISVQALSNLEIKNLTISNLYVRISGNGSAFDPRSAGNGVYFAGNVTNGSVHNCNISWCGNGVVFGYSAGTSTNNQIYSNTIMHCSWGIGVQATSANATSKWCKVWANVIDYCNYDGWSGADHFHNDGIICSVGQYPCLSTGMEVYRNRIGPTLGTNLTSHIYIESASNCNQNEMPMVHNNLILISSGTTANSGIIGIIAYHPIVANNTIVNVTGPILNTTYNQYGFFGVGIEPSASQCDDSAEFYNNYFQDLAIPFWYKDGSVKANNVNYNVYANHRPGPLLNGSVAWGYLSNMSYTWAQWVANLGFDKNSKTNVPVMNTNYQPLASDTVLVGRGKNLSATGINMDYYGNPRPTGTDAWTIGAFEVTGSSSRPQPPSNVQATPPETP